MARSFSRFLVAAAACALVLTAGADQILIDDGATQLNVGSSANDGTGDPMRTGALKMKQWASDINDMMAELYRVTTGSTYYIKNCPGVALDGVTDDAPAINVCIAAQPAGTTFVFPSGTTIGLKAPLTGFKSFQRFIGNGATLKAITVSALLGASLANGANSVTVADRTGFTCGQIIKAGSRNGSTSATLTNTFSIITGTAGIGNCAAATGSGPLYVAATFGTCATLDAAGGCGTTPTITTGAGVNVISSGVLFYNSDDDATDVEIAGFTLDGNRPVGGDVNVRIPRWEPDKIIETNRGGRAYVHDIFIKNADGDGVSIAGDFSRVFNIQGLDIGGNLVHFAEGYYQQGARIAGTNLNLAGAFMGHQDGMISFSNKCNFTLLSDLNAFNAKTVVGGLDAYGGTHLSITGIIGTNLTQGPIEINYASTAQQATANGTTTLAVAETRGFLTGMNLSGTYIVAGTYITAVDPDASTITLSQAASGSGATTVTLSGGASDITITNGLFDNSNSSVAGTIRLKGNSSSGSGQGEWLNNIRISNVVAKNTMLWASYIEDSDIELTLDNAGRSVLNTTMGGLTTVSVYISDSANSNYNVNVDGSPTGVHLAGAATKNITVSGRIRNPVGSYSEAVFLDNTLPTHPEVLLTNLHIVLDTPLSATTWAQSTAYSTGAVVSNNSRNYIARVGGTSASSGSGPLTADESITDGGVTWGYVNTPGRFTATTGDTGSKGIDAAAGFALTDSVFEVTTGSGVIKTQARVGNTPFQVDIRRNTFRNVMTSASIPPIWFNTHANRLVFVDNTFPGYDQLYDQTVLGAAYTYNDVLFSRNTFASNKTGGTAASLVRFRGTVARGVFKDNVFPYRSTAGSTWTAPGTWAEQTTTSSDPLRVDETVTDTLVIGNVMRKAASP